VNPEQNELFDAAIDRAARRIVEHDPPPRMYARVRSALDDVRRSRGRWWLWPLVGVPAAVVTIVALVIWARPDAPVVTVGAPAARSQPERPTPNEPQTRRAAVASQITSPQLPRPQPTSPEPEASELAAAIRDVRVREIAMGDVAITPITLEPVGFDPIPISEISLEPQ